ncbi:hypothetical protein X975_15272, partial [Stegodyphus mimosarum]
MRCRTVTDLLPLHFKSRSLIAGVVCLSAAFWISYRVSACLPSFLANLVLFCAGPSFPFMVSFGSSYQRFFPCCSFLELQFLKLKAHLLYLVLPSWQKMIPVKYLEKLAYWCCRDIF